MRALLLAVLVVAACDRRVDQQVRPIVTPSARGGGPPVSLGPADARRRIAEARCSLARACGESDEVDACRTRIEAETQLECAIDAGRLDACVEAIRAQTCSERTAPEECAHVCSKEIGP